MSTPFQPGDKVRIRSGHSTADPHEQLGTLTVEKSDQQQTECSFLVPKGDDWVTAHGFFATGALEKVTATNDATEQPTPPAAE